MAMRTPQAEHCTLDEAHNLQVTRPHLAWHLPTLEEMSRSGNSVRVVHWPGRPKPWRLGPGQRTSWEQLWWRIHTDLCGNHDGKSRNCWMQCDSMAGLATY